MDGCETMEVWLSLRLDGMLEPEEERELEAHLAVCPRCRALAQELEAVHTVFPQLEDCSAPEGFAQGVMERIGALEQKPKVVPLFRRPQVRALAGLAACAVLCIGLYRGGMLNQSVDSLEVESAGASLDAATYEPADPSAADQNTAAPETEESATSSEEQKDTAVRVAPDPAPADGSGDASSGDGSLSVPQTQDSIQPSQFQVGTQMAQGYTVAGQTVWAVLTMDRLPQGWEDVLGQSPEWLTDEAGRTCCMITAGQLQQLQTLAQQDGAISSSLQGQAEEDQSCALVLLENP